MPDIVIGREDADEKKYMLKNRDVVVRQPVNRVTWEKWDGFWKPPVKFIDNYSVTINGTRLDEKKMDRFVLKSWAGIHQFKISKFDVEEVCFAPENHGGFVSVIRITNNSERTEDVSVSLEAKIDMHEEFESVHGRGYASEFDSVRSANVVTTEGKGWQVCYGIGKMHSAKAVSSGKETYEKIPGKEMFVPKRISVSVEVHSGEEVMIPLIFCAETDREKNIKTCFDNISSRWDTLLCEKEKIYDGLRIEPNHMIKSVGLKTPNENINKAFYWALANIADIGRQGHPASSEIDIKRLLWSVFGLVDAGKFAKAKEVLDGVASFSEVHIPSKITSDNTVIFDSEDVNPLFLVALERYVRHSGDRAFEDGLRGQIIRIIRKLKLTDGLARPMMKVSILDPAYYDDTRIEMQSLWIEALKTYHPSKYSMMSQALDTYFWDTRERFLNDSLRDDAVKSSNVLVPLFFDQIRDFKRDNVLKKIRQEYISDHGVRTRGIFDPEYRAGDAGFGAARSFATALAATAYFNSDDCKTGLKLLKILSRHMFNYDLGLFQDIVNSADGVPISYQSSSDSASIFVHAVDEGIFGIRPDMAKGEINFSPKLVDEWHHYERFGKAVGEHSVHVKVNRSHERFADITIDFDARPDVRINLNLPDNIEYMEINRIKYEGNRASIQPGKNNKIWAYYKMDEGKIEEV